MLNDLSKNFLAFLFLPCLIAGGADAQVTSNRDRPKIETPSNLDLSTDEAVLAELQKRVDAEREKLGLGKAGSSEIKANSIRVIRQKNSAKIIVVSSFLRHHGSVFKGAYINWRYFSKDDAALSENALNALGWKKANRAEREQLAKLWVEKGLQAFSRVVYTKNEDFTGDGFQPPQVVSTKNGEIKVTLWVIIPPGRKPMSAPKRTNFQFLEFRFTKDGNLSES